MRVVESLYIFMLLGKHIPESFFFSSFSYYLALGYFAPSVTALSGLETIVNQFSENVHVIV